MSQVNFVKEMTSKPIFKIGTFHVKLYHLGLVVVAYFLIFKNK